MSGCFFSETRCSLLVVIVFRVHETLTYMIVFFQ